MTMIGELLAMLSDFNKQGEIAANLHVNSTELLTLNKELMDMVDNLKEYQARNPSQNLSGILNDNYENPSELAYGDSIFGLVLRPPKV